MNIAFKRLTEVDKKDIIDLMNNEKVRRQMPLFIGEFNEEICKKFILSKEQLWLLHGYGPWAFVLNNEFIGWGGLQPENGDADLALVLHPDHWGLGKHLYKEIVKRAFGEMKLTSITVLFPPSRTRVQGLIRLGFKKEQELTIDKHQFIKYRLKNTKHLGNER